MRHILFHRSQLHSGVRMNKGKHDSYSTVTTQEDV